jgi:hypothetical protein
MKPMEEPPGNKQTNNESDMGRKKIDQRRRRTKPQNRRKMSKIVWEFAGDFILMGDTIDERQSLLNAACSAWNIASDPPGVRQQNLDNYLREYERCNRDVDQQEVEDVRYYTEKLIEKKLRMFPNDLRQIVDAQIVDSGGQERIRIASVIVE